MTAAATPALDLFTSAELAEAKAACALAEEAWKTAERRYRYAPHGERETRRQALLKASQAALQAAAKRAAAERKAGL